MLMWQMERRAAERRPGMSELKKLLSVAIPAYGRREELCEAIRSVAVSLACARGRMACGGV